MKLVKNLKKILLIGSAVLMFTSVGTGTGNLTASARRRYRPRVTRHYRRHARRFYRRNEHARKYRNRYIRKHYTRKRNKRAKVAHKLKAQNNKSKARKSKAKLKKPYNKQTDPKFCAQQSEDAVKQINGYRKARGLEPYQEDKELNSIAMMRARNMASNKEYYSHYDKKNHEWYADEDAYKLGYIKSPKTDYFGENIANGYESSKAANNDFMYHDSPSWIHRANILDSIKDSSYVGAGYYNGYLVEEFTYAPTSNLDQVYNN